MSGPVFELAIERPAPGGRDAVRSLLRQLRAAILDARLSPGAALPPTRSAQAVFGVARNTAVEVYDRLAAEGLVVSRQGSGTRVSDPLPQRADAARGQSAPAGPALNPLWLDPAILADIGFWRSDEEDPHVDPSAPPTDFRPALVDPALFEHAAFRRLMAQQLRGAERQPASNRSPQGRAGAWRLRDAIARHIAVTRAVVCRPEEVMVTAGAQQAFDLLARTLVPHPGAVVAVEDPGYPPLRAAFRAAGARLVPVPVDSEGMRPQDIPAAARVICLSPSHQFPLGVTMSRARRAELIALAQARGAAIVEDDYDGEFRYDGAPLDALRSRDEAGVVFYVGTFSKCMLPSLRLGFVIAPAWARPALIAARNCADWHSPTPIQAATAAFIAQGLLTRHVRKLRRLYQARRRLVLEALAGPLSPWLEPIPSVYGLHVSAYARPGVDCDAAARALLRRNVRVHSLSRYYLAGEGRQGLVFGYGAASEAQIARGLAELGSWLFGRDEAMEPAL